MVSGQPKPVKEKTMKLFNRSALMGFVAVGVLALAQVQPASAQDLKVRISTDSTPGASTQVILAAFGDALKEELGDNITVEYFDSGQLGDEIVHMEQVRTGQIDVTPIGSDAVQLDSKWAIFDMPFLFPNFEKAHAFLDSPLGDEMKASMRERVGLQVLALGDVGFRHITNNRGPIFKPEDLEGLKMRVPGSQTRIMAFKHFGAAPVTMNMGELYLALQQGTMDGQENPLQSVISRSMQEVQKYLSLSSHVFTPATLVMNGARWDSLTDEQKAAFSRAAAKAVKVSRDYAAESDLEGRTTLAKSMEVNEIDSAAFQAAAIPVWGEIAKVAGGDFGTRVIAFVTAK
jgi:tripartite ATP-independent transporter DctP family solute receptor